MRIPAQIEEFRAGSPETMQASVGKRRKFGVDADKLLGMRIRKRLQKNGIDYCEYAGGGSDPVHQAKHRRGDKTQIFAHHARRELEVLPQRFHGISPRGRDTFETCYMFRKAERLLWARLGHLTGLEQFGKKLMKDVSPLRRSSNRL